MFDRGAWLGQTPLILGPSSWGAGMVRSVPVRMPPYFGLWTAITPDGDVIDSGRVGPFMTVDQAIRAASAEAHDAAVQKIGMDGHVQVVDGTGAVVASM